MAGTATITMSMREIDRVKTEQAVVDRGALLALRRSISDWDRSI